jgi:hypothetical protein
MGVGRGRRGGRGHLPHTRPPFHLPSSAGLLGDSAAQHLSSLTSLTALDAFSVRLHEPGAAAIAHLANLRRLELCGGCLTGVGLFAACCLQGRWWCWFRGSG